MTGARPLGWTARSCLGVACLLSVLGLLGWVTPHQALARVLPASIPMAPTAAVAVLAIATSLVVQGRRERRRALVGVAVALLASGNLAAFAFDFPQYVDALLVPAPEVLHGVPTGRMAPWTAAGLALAGLAAVSLQASEGRRTMEAVGVGLALAVSGLGGVVTLGYLFGAPLLYGGPTVPVAFSTGLALACLGLGLVATAPSDVAPLRLITGSSVRSRLLRAFLPVAPLAVAVAVAFDQVEGLNPALHTALATLLTALAVAAFVSYAARGVASEFDRVQAERERSWRDAARLAAIVQSSTDAIYATDLDGVITAWNPAAERLFGYSHGEAIGRCAATLVPSNGERERKEMLGAIRRGESVTHEVERVPRDGGRVLVSVSKSPLRDVAGRVVGASVIARDLSELRRTERALLDSEKALRAFFDSDVAGVLFGDDHGGTVANGAFLRLTGYSQEDLEAGRLAWAEITPPEFRERDEAGIREALARGACTPYEKQYVRKDGSRVWVMVSYAVLEAASRRHVGFVVDVDARKRVEEDLRRSEERFAKVFRSSVAAIGIGEVGSGRLIEVNARYAEFFGYRPEEMVGRTVFELGLWASAADRERLVGALSDTHPSSSGEVAFRHRSGEVKHALAWAESIHLSGNPEPLALLGFVDVTERRRLELQFLQSQKLEAVGRLAGGVAHDFNNVLGVIVGYGEMLAREATEAQRGKLDQILQAAHRAAGLTRQLLAFSRKQVVEPKVVDLNVLVSDVEKMLGRLIGEDIDLAIVPGADLGHVRADPGHLEQVVMNLCVNARDAMPEGGLLRLETANVDLEAADAAAYPPMTPGAYVMLAVSDTGCGIEKQDLPKLFEPFFTTKEKGKGTGLGLATVYGIVKQAGGFVWVESEVGRGSAFRVYLPRVDEPTTPRAAREPVALTGGSETILLVEDEASLREVVRGLLEEHGYTVIEANGPNDAVEISRRYESRIDLLLTDVVMPGVSGRQLAEALCAVRPGLRVLYMSGYTDEIVAHRGVLGPNTRLISKPFTVSSLLQRVREVLSEKPPGGATT